MNKSLASTIVLIILIIILTVCLVLKTGNYNEKDNMEIIKITNTGKIKDELTEVCSQDN